MVTDSITDYFFTTSEHANLNLKNEGVSESSIFYVGNVMIDSLFYHLNKKITPQKIIQKLFPKKKFSEPVKKI